MPLPQDINLLSQGSAKGETRLSLEQYSNLAQDHLVYFTESQQVLRMVHTPFKEKCNIRPVQCRGAIKSLEEMIERVQEFCELLNETERVPMIFIALRYRHFFVLRLIEDRARKLIDLIDNFRIVCMAPSKHMSQQRKEISDSFEALLQHIIDISRQIKFLEDEAKFQARTLTVP